MYLNKSLLIGNLTRDPEAKTLPSGIHVTSFSIATNRVWKDKNGAKQESADFHNIVIFGKQAKNAAKYLKKGQSVFVEGRNQTRSWDKPDGSKAYRTEIVVENIQYGSRQTPDSAVSDDGSDKTIDIATNEEKTSRKAKDKPPMGQQIEYPSEDIDPNDF